MRGGRQWTSLSCDGEMCLLDPATVAAVAAVGAVGAAATEAATAVAKAVATAVATAREGRMCVYWICLMKTSTRL